VLGYSVSNDVSSRHWQRFCNQWVKGKSFDTFCPIGPVLVTPEVIPDPGTHTRPHPPHPHHVAFWSCPRWLLTRVCVVSAAVCRQARDLVASERHDDAGL